MFRRLLRYRPKKRSGILFIYSLSIIIILSTLAGALAVPAFALPPALIKARTIGELIITLFAGAGTAITSPTIVPAIYSNYGTTEYSLENLVNQGIIYDESGTMTKQEIIDNLGSYEIEAPRAFNLDNTAFRNLMETNWASMEQYGIDSVMRLGDIANSDSVYGAIDNLGQFMLDIANYGYLGAENAIAVVTNPGTFVNVTFEDILNAIKNKFGASIVTKLPLATKIPSNFDSDSRLFVFIAPSSGSNAYTKGMYLQDSIKTIYNSGGFNDGYGNFMTLVNPTESTLYYQWFDRNQNVANGVYIPDPLPSQRTSVNSKRYNTYGIGYTIHEPAKVFGADYTVNDENERLDLINRLIQGENVPPAENDGAPDVVNQIQGNINDLDEVEPLVKDGDLISVVPQSNYNEFINDTDQNYEDGNGTGNGIIMDEFMDPYIMTTTNPDDPSDPGEGGEVIPSQPTIAPRPTGIPSENQDVLDALSTPGLETIFPFCLPFDLDYLFRKFMAEPKTPKIVIPFKIDRFGINESITLDFAMFNDVASLLRKLMVIAYIVFLIFETRNMIGA